MKLFLDTEHAAEMLGCTKRHFARKYVVTGLLKPIVFKRGGDRADGRNRRQMFLLKDVEKLK